MRWTSLILALALLVAGQARLAAAQVDGPGSTTAPALASAPVETPPANAPGTTPVWRHVHLTNGEVDVELTSYRGALVRMALVHEHTLKLPPWRSAAVATPPGPQPVLDAFNPVADMNNFVAGLDLPIDPTTEGAWAWTPEGQTAGTFRKTYHGLAYGIRYTLDAVRPEVHVELTVENLRAAAADLRLALRPLDGIHQDDPVVEAAFLKYVAHGGGTNGTMTTWSLPTVQPATVPKIDSLDYLALKSRFFAAWWTPGAAGPLLVKGATRQALPYTLGASVLPYQRDSPAGAEHQAMLAVDLPADDQAAWSVPPGAQLSLSWSIAVSCMTKDELAKLRPDEQELEYTDSFYRFFKSIANIMTWALRLIAKVVHSNGVAVILLTFLLKLLLHRFTHKQYESTARMQKLQPELRALQDQYRNDKQTLAVKQMELWKKHGVNPLGGCLPVLVQIPVFMALYQSFYHAADMRGQPFLWIRDLTLPDQLLYLHFSMPSFVFNGTPATINPLPIAYIVVTIWMSMLQKPPSMGDPQQEQTMKMMRWLPAFFGVIFYNMPAGLVLYFTVQALLSAIEIKIIKRRLGLS